MGNASFYRSCICSEILKFRLSTWITKYGSSSWDIFGLEVERAVESLFTVRFSPPEEALYLSIFFIFREKSVVSKNRKNPKQQLLYVQTALPQEEHKYRTAPCSPEPPLFREESLTHSEE